MKVVNAFSIVGRGLALITDEVFSPAAFTESKGKKKLRFVLEDQMVELNILGVEAVLLSDGREFVSFIVPHDETLRAITWDRPVELS